MLTGSFFLPHNQRVILLKSSLLLSSQMQTPACEVIENAARVCLAKYQIVIIEFWVT